jgi:hypothetical protein
VPVKGFQAMPVFAPDEDFTFAGITKTGAGAALASCHLDLFRTADDSKAGETDSDANGVYLLYASSELTHYAVAYKTGAPDVAGTTVNTLIPTTTTTHIFLRNPTAQDSGGSAVFRPIGSPIVRRLVP